MLEERARGAGMRLAEWVREVLLASPVEPGQHSGPDYARKIIAEGFGPASDYPFGPFPSDYLTYKGKKLVEFTTPGHHKGLGTMSWLLPSDQPITALPCSPTHRPRHGPFAVERAAAALAFFPLCDPHSTS